MGGNEGRMIVLCMTALVLGSPAAAQTAGAGRWEVELHGGGILPANPAGGTVSLPGPGAVFTTATTMPTPPPESRREPSWYFGDGALLFNQAVAALAQLPGRIVPLDPVLGRSLGERRSGGSIGIRVSRVLTRRLSAELSVDYGFARLRITPANRDALEATRASFIPAFDGMITFNPNRVVNSLTSTAALDDGGGREVVSSGALIVNLRTSGTIIPYATLGAGLVSVTGERPSAILRGNYQFRLPGGPPINETDNVTVSDDRSRHTAAGILGGGVKYDISSRWGLRFDARVIISKSTTSTTLDAAPNVALGLTPVGRGVLGGNPSVQFTNNSTDPVTALGVTAVAASTLTGPALTDVRTFAGSGAESRTNISFGVFWRF